MDQVCRFVKLLAGLCLRFPDRLQFQQGIVHCHFLLSIYHAGGAAHFG